MAERGSKKAGSKVTVTGAKKRGAKKAGAGDRPARRSGRMIYAFGARTDGDGSMKDLLGGKGANLAAMTEMGLPVPPGFTITTRVCADYHANGQRFPSGLMDGVGRAMRALEIGRAHV